MNTRSCPGQHFFGRVVAVALGLAPAVVPSAQPTPDDPPAQVGRLAGGSVRNLGPAACLSQCDFHLLAKLP